MDVARTTIQYRPIAGRCRSLDKLRMPSDALIAESVLPILARDNAQQSL